MTSGIEDLIKAFSDDTTAGAELDFEYEPVNAKGHASESMASCGAGDNQSEEEDDNEKESDPTMAAAARVVKMASAAFSDGEMDHLIARAEARQIRSSQKARAQQDSLISDVRSNVVRGLQAQARQKEQDSLISDVRSKVVRGLQANARKEEQAYAQARKEEQASAKARKEEQASAKARQNVIARARSIKQDAISRQAAKEKILQENRSDMIIAKARAINDEKKRAHSQKLLTGMQETAKINATKISSAARSASGVDFSAFFTIHNFKAADALTWSLLLIFKSFRAARKSFARLRFSGRLSPSGESSARLFPVLATLCCSRRRR
jgi:hypothetical protein